MNNVEFLPATPTDEPEAQVGHQAYRRLALMQCKAMIGMLRREFLEEPTGSKLVIGRNNHDYGMYYDIQYKFNSEDDKHWTYAAKLDDMWPVVWDMEARAYLDAHNEAESLRYNEKSNR